MTDSLLHSLAVWALLHEAADEGWKAVVARGRAAGGTEPAGSADGVREAGASSPDAFVDALAGLVAEEKERLKAALVEGPAAGWAEGLATGALRSETMPSDGGVAELRFELAEIRARLESMEVALDTLLRRSEPPARA